MPSFSRLGLGTFDDGEPFELVGSRISAARGVEYEEGTIHPFGPEAPASVADSPNDPDQPAEIRGLEGGDSGGSGQHS